MGRDLSTTQPKSLTGMQVIRALWPLNAVFRPHLARIRTVKYRSRCEVGADQAIKAFSVSPTAAAWENNTPGVWRVLLERHQQLLTVAALNHGQGNLQFTSLPDGLPDHAVMPGLMLLWLHSMKLPFPVEDRSALELSADSLESSLKLH